MELFITTPNVLKKISIASETKRGIFVHKISEKNSKTVTPSPFTFNKTITNDSELKILSEDAYWW